MHFIDLHESCAKKISDKESEVAGELRDPHTAKIAELFREQPGITGVRAQAVQTYLRWSATLTARKEKTSEKNQITTVEREWAVNPVRKGFDCCDGGSRMKTSAIVPQAQK